MNKYLLVEIIEDGDRVFELTPINDQELEAIRPILQSIAQVKYQQDVGETTLYSLYGHMDAFETFVQFIPDPEFEINKITKIQLTEITENILA